MTNTLEHRDPQNYRLLSEPFPSADVANEQVAAFWMEVGDLRKKYKIRDLLSVVMIAVKHDDGEESEHMLTLRYGNSMYSEAMAAFALGQETESRQQNIAKLAFHSVVKAGARSRGAGK